jgi:hypothetical protein
VDAVVTLQVNSPIGLLRGRQGLSAPPWYTTWSPSVARATIGTLAGLEPRIVASGHGRPIVGPEAADALRELGVRTLIGS